MRVAGGTLQPMSERKKPQAAFCTKCGEQHGILINTYPVKSGCKYPFLCQSCKDAWEKKSRVNLDEVLKEK